MGEYDRGEKCGVILKEEFVNDRLFDDDEGSMHLGTYFEWKAFKNLPKSGIEPKPKMMANGKEPLAAYRMADINALRVTGQPELGIKGIFEEMGLKVIHRGKRITLGRFQGTIDLIVMVIKNRKFEDGTRWRKGDKFVIDIKYSGLLSESASFYNKHGWRWSPVQKEYHSIQAKQYHMLTRMPFYFMVWQSNNKQGTDSDVQLFRVPVSESDVEEHKAQGNAYFDRFQVMAKADHFEPKPNMKRCNDCPLKASCKFKHNFPHPVTVNL